MALFTVNRFLGEETENETPQSPKVSAQLILKQIHDRAKQRKRAASLSKESPVVVKQEKRSRTDSVESETPEHGTKNDIQTSPDSSKKEKRKKKKASTKTPSSPGSALVAGEKDGNLAIKKERDDSSDDEGDGEEKNKGEEKQDQEVVKEEQEMEDEDGDENDGQLSGQSHREIGGFTVIGDVRKKTIEKVQRVLPDWLVNPSIVKNNLKDESHGLDSVKSLLDQSLLEKLERNGISYLFPVQRLVIPVLLGSKEGSHILGPAGYRPSDICCSAPTGSGKTLAYVLPIVQALKSRVIRRVRALVVLPVRDLATQVYTVFLAYCQGTKLKVELIVGQKPFKNEQSALVKKSVRGLQSQADIIVATPGRLVDHIKQTEGFNLHHLRYLVIDEADRMMDDMKQDWLTLVEQAVFDEDRPQPGHLTAASANMNHFPKLLFSATLSQNPEKLQQLNLFQPKLFTSLVDWKQNVEDDEGDNPSTATGDITGKYTTPDGLSEFMIEAGFGYKPLLVLYLLHVRKYRQVLCFTNTVESTHRLYHLLRIYGGIEVREFSSNLTRDQRAKIIKDFAEDKIDVLVCSDAMARGMDIENVKCVIAYDHAPYIKTYIHRIGRTARAGKVGTAITLLEKKEIFHFKKMMKDAGKSKVDKMKIISERLEPMVENYQKALEQLPSVLKGEKKSTKR